MKRTGLVYDFRHQAVIVKMPGRPDDKAGKSGNLQKGIRNLIGDIAVLRFTGFLNDVGQTPVYVKNRIVQIKCHFIQ